jgi:hypothetical protein
MAGLQGRIFGGFQLVEQLPGGGIAEVYRGSPTRPGGREVVVKVFYPEFARQPGFQEQFQKIVQGAAQLASHPHVLPLVASGDESGYLYLVTPYVAAGTLRDRIQQGDRLGAVDVGPFFRQLCDALGYAHSLGIVHGNVKPSNIFLFEGRHVLLGDFGLLWNIALMDMEHAGSGTEAVEYLAPEVASGASTQQSDVYSVGAVLYAALVGRAPFSAKRPSEVFAAHAHQPVPHLAQATPAAAPPVLVLDGVIQRAMAKRPQDRYASATAVAQAIEATIRQAPGLPVPALVPVPAPGMQPVQPVQAALPPGAAPFGAVGAPGALGAPVSLPLPGHAFPSAGLAFPSVGPAFAPAAPPPSAALGTLGQLNPPFPPLPASATVDGQMEQGRAPGSGPGDSTQQATLRIPAPQLPSGDVGVPSAPPTAPPGESAWAGLMDDPDEDNAVLRMPAIRRPGTSPAGLRASGGPRLRPGFTVAGGSASLPGPGTAGSELLDGAGTSDNAAGGAFATASSDSSWLGAGINGPLGEPEHYDTASGWHEQQPGERPALHMGDDGQWVSDQADQPGQRPFSPTQLGLPRLTSPAMEGMPPSWQELVSGKLPAYHAPNGSRRHGQDGAEIADWQAEANGAWRGAESDAWGQSLPGSRPLPAVPNGRVGLQELSDPWDSAANGQLSMPGPIQQRPAEMRPAPMDDPDDYLAFDDDRVWTQGLTAVRRKGRRWVRRLMLMLVLVLLVDITAVVVVRPDLCPTEGCRALHATLVQRLPILAHIGAPTATPLAADPAAFNLTVAAGKSVSVQLNVTNTHSAPVNWQAKSTLSWLTVDRSGGTLAAGASIKLTVTAKPANTKPGTYTGVVTLVAGDATVTIPATIVINASS